MTQPTPKFLLPSPNFGSKSKECPTKPKPHYLTPSGMTILPREKQPPPMYGKRGATVPPRFLKQPNATSPTTPEPTRQYCEPCEMELASLEDLKHHRSQHEKCPVDGCQYRGHATVMDKHVAALHSSGLFDKFKKLNTPEEIAAWREERRKRFPTVANVLLKQKAQEQRQKRGERLEASKCRFGKQDDRKRAVPNVSNDGDAKDNGVVSKEPNESNGKQKQQANKRNNKKKRKNQRDRKDNKAKTENKVENQKQSTSSDDEDDKGIVRFPGTRVMKDYKHLQVKVKETKNVLLSLVGMYGSDDDDDDEDENEDQEKVEGVAICSEATDKEETNYTINTEKSTEVANVEGENFPIKDETLDSCKVKSSANGNYVTTEKALKDSTTDPDISYSDDGPEKATVQKVQKEVEKTAATSSIAENKMDTLPPSVSERNSSESPIEMPTEHQIAENIKNSSSQQPIPPNPNSSDEGPEEVPISHQMTEYKFPAEKPTTSTSSQPTKSLKQHEENKTKPPKMSVKRKSGLDYRKAKLRKQNTMLEKLLETDIRHERNVLLQCVRYVCENNFFGIGKPNTNAS
ncbi:nuclear FMR1 interacting protein 1 [Musca autumnalis]|uniref:nuclear FMR1 interacting protein 1 n=1 Tax=Musca autumnalis TaxID=221902 RepID=UPI003CEAB252